MVVKINASFQHRTFSPGQVNFIVVFSICSPCQKKKKEFLNWFSFFLLKPQKRTRKVGHNNKQTAGIFFLFSPLMCLKCFCISVWLPDASRRVVASTTRKSHSQTTKLQTLRWNLSLTRLLISKAFWLFDVIDWRKLDFFSWP